MKTAYLVVGLVSVLVGLVAGALLGSSDIGSGGGPEDAAATPLYWAAPMDPDYRRDAPGKSPMGMDLVPVFEASDGDASLPGVRVSPDVAHNFGVRTEPVRRQALASRVRTFGNVVLAEPQVEHVHTRIAGWIEVLVADVEGDPVSAGDVLLEIYAPELVRAQEEFLLARSSSDTGLQSASTGRLRALGMTAAQITALGRSGEASERISIRAPRDGFVMNLAVRQGMFVEPRMEVMAIAALDPVWVLAEVFERDVPKVSPGQVARLSFDFLPGRTFVGTVDHVYPELDPRVRTLQVRITFDNVDGALRPGMFGDVELISDGGAEVLVVPASALIRGTSAVGSGESPDRVVVQIDEGRFRSRAVRIGRVEPDRVEILAGVREGERVVVSGQFLIDSESDVDADLLRMGASLQESVCATGVAARGTFLTMLPSSGDRQRVRIDHEPVQALNWPAMVMPFELATDAEVPDLAAGAAIRFCIERSEGGAILVRDLAPESGAGSGAVMTDSPAHEAMTHEAMGHGARDHGAMDHGSMDRGSMAAEEMDHGAMGHGAMPAEAMDHAAMGHGAMPAEAVDHEARDHGSMDSGAPGHGAIAPESMDHGSMGNGSKEPAAPDADRSAPR